MSWVSDARLKKEKKRKKKRKRKESVDCLFVQYGLMR